MKSLLHSEETKTSVKVSSLTSEWDRPCLMSVIHGALPALSFLHWKCINCGLLYGWHLNQPAIEGGSSWPWQTPVSFLQSATQWWSNCSRMPLNCKCAAWYPPTKDICCRENLLARRTCNPFRELLFWNASTQYPAATPKTGSGRLSVLLGGEDASLDC